MPVKTLKSVLQLLGVTEADDAKAVRRAWLSLVRTYHPDMYRGDKAAANARLAEINAAYDLVDEYVSNARDAASQNRENQTGFGQAKERQTKDRQDQARQDRVNAAIRAKQAEAARRDAAAAKKAADDKAASERVRTAQAAARADADTQNFEAELDALKIKRAADERRAKAAYKSRAARRPVTPLRRSQAETIAARAARAAFLLARKVLESEFVEQGDPRKTRYA